MVQETCYEVFQDGCLTRIKHPLPYGHYKLRECWERLGGTARELDRIKELVSGRGDKWSLMHCTSEDKHVWLKSVPYSVAWRLGYEVLPGLKALIGDGVPQAEIDSLFPTLAQNVKALVSRLETARRRISKDIGYEYLLMRQGTPLLSPLVKEAIYLSEQALQLHSGFRSMDSCV